MGLTLTRAPSRVHSRKARRSIRVTGLAVHTFIENSSAITAPHRNLTLRMLRLTDSDWAVRDTGPHVVFERVRLLPYVDTDSRFASD